MGPENIYAGIHEKTAQEMTPNCADFNQLIALGTVVTAGLTIIGIVLVAAYFAFVD